MRSSAFGRLAILAVVTALIAVVLSLSGCGGPEVPDVVGMRQADAVRALQDAGYLLGDVSAIATTSVEVGLIAAQDPPAGTRLKEGEKVALSANFSNGVDALVPSVVGLEQVTAENVATSTGFVPLVVEQYVVSVAKGFVAAQVPEAESETSSGATLVIVVSKGEAPETSKVPDVEGKSESAATSAIEDAGFDAKVVKVYDSDVDKGDVIAQSPDAGDELVVGSEVQIVVSLGKGTGTVSVPNVTGKKEADAVNALEDKGFNPEIFRQYSDTVAKGVVAEQFPDSGSTVAKGADVAIVVSLGKEPAGTVKVPDVMGMTEADAVDALEGEGLKADLQRAQSSTVESGTVGYQFPVGGEDVVPGSSVLVVVSSGGAD